MKSIIFIIICNLLICNLQFSQNITNTLGTSGIFSIKSGATNFLTLNQTNGNTTFLRNVELGNQLNSSLTIGVITKNGTRFLHNFAPAGVNANNTFLGFSSGNFTMSGTGSQASFNTCIGAFSLFSNTTGTGNTSLGYVSLYSNNSGTYNTAIGYGSLNSNTSGTGNTAIGYNTLAFGDGFEYNTAVGYLALYNNMNNENTAVGYQSLYANTGGFGNTAIGSKSLFNNNTGNFNTVLGYLSLYNNTSGLENVAIGYESMLTGSNGRYNVAVGYQTLKEGNGQFNTSIGHRSMENNISGVENTALGSSTLNVISTGSRNTALGTYSGNSVSTGTNLTLVGYDSEPTSPSATNQITLGNNLVTSLRCNVTSISSLSDMRDKKNITDLSLGLDFIAKLKPRQFNWDKREWYDDNTSDGSKMQEIPTAGFIAQELDEVQTTENVEWLNLVLKDNPEKLEATYGNLLPVMVKAIQELKAENDELRSENDGLRSELESLKTINSRVLALEDFVRELRMNKSEKKFTENK